MLRGIMLNIYFIFILMLYGYWESATVELFVVTITLMVLSRATRGWLRCFFVLSCGIFIGYFKLESALPYYMIMADFKEIITDILEKITKFKIQNKKSLNYDVAGFDIFTENILVALIVGGILFAYSIFIGLPDIANIVLSLAAVIFGMTNKKLVTEKQRRSMELLEKKEYIMRQENSYRSQISKVASESILSERNRISSELHDFIGHSISSAIVQLEAIRLTGNDSSEMRMVISTLKSGMNNIRKSLHNLHSESIDLNSAIGEIIAMTPNIDVNVSIPKNLKMNFNNKKLVIQIFTELIQNAIKHSNASNIRFAIIEHPVFYSISYTDNGVGIAKEILQNTKKRLGIGLSFLSEISKGSLRIRNNSGGGLSIHLTLMKE